MERQSSSVELFKQDILERMRALRNDWRDGIPDEIIHSFLGRGQKEKYVDTKWKVRKAWFQVVAFVLSDVIRRQYSGERIISQNLLSEVLVYHRALTTPSEFHWRPTVQGDIDRAEAIMAKITVELEG